MGDDVSRYYNRNTRSFLRFGRGSGDTGTIHRALLAPGVSSQAEALHYIHGLIADAFIDAGIAAPAAGPPASSAVDPAGGAAPPAGTATAGATATPAAGTTPPLIADLGCGVGASMEWLSGQIAARFVGITLSEMQAAVAADRLRGHRLPGHVVRGSFAEPEDLKQMLTAETQGDHPRDPAAVDGAYMIESYNHGPSATATLSAVAQVIRPGGILAICDDIPARRLVDLIGDRETPATPETSRDTRRAIRWTREFRRGWHAHTFEPEERLTAIARERGFLLERSVDLSAYVALDRPRDRLIRLIAGPAALLRFRSAWWDNIRGGNALQQLEKAGLMEYRLLIFRRTDTP